MGRIRTVKPELRTDLIVASWPMAARYAWVLLWGYLDDAGRGIDDVRLLKADLFPLDDAISARKVAGYVDTWESAGRICRYEMCGRRYLHAVNWSRHQRINRPSPSRIPACPRHGGLTECSLPELGTGNREQGTGVGELGDLPHHVPVPRGPVDDD